MNARHQRRSGRPDAALRATSAADRDAHRDRAVGAGERLPPVRQLARDLGIAPCTVARAVQELEQAGLVQTRRGGGTTVAPIARSPSRMTRARLDAAATTFVASVRTLGGLTQEDAHEAVAGAWA